MVVALIYKKHSKVSDATNKEFDNGEIVNFVQVDANRVFWVSQQMATISRIPFLFMIAFTVFFYLFKWTFLAGVGVVSFAICI